METNEATETQREPINVGDEVVIYRERGPNGWQPHPVNVVTITRKRPGGKLFYDRTLIDGRVVEQVLDARRVWKASPEEAATARQFIEASRARWARLRERTIEATRAARREIHEIMDAPFEAWSMLPLWQLLKVSAWLEEAYAAEVPEGSPADERLA